MSKSQPTDDPNAGQTVWPKLALRRMDQAAAAALVAASLIAIAGWCVWQTRLRQRLIDIDLAPPVAVDFKIDVNSAEWPELALMPGIGEQIAKRIVAERAANGPYRDLDELRRVRGIGPRTLEGMKPFLLPPSEVETTAESH